MVGSRAHPPTTREKRARDGNGWSGSDSTHVTTKGMEGKGREGEGKGKEPREGTPRREQAATGNIVEGRSTAQKHRGVAGGDAEGTREITNGRGRHTG